MEGFFKSGRYSREEDMLLRMMAHRGLNVAEIAIRLQRSINSIKGRGKKLGININGFKRWERAEARMSPTVVAWIRKQLLFESNAEVVCHVLGINENQLYQLAEKYDFPLKPRKKSSRQRHTPCMLPLETEKICREQRCYLKTKCPIYKGEAERRYKIGDWQIKEATW
ncbi:MAG: hypothetical protein Kow0037_00990 [Calditrichia bacterium]